MLQALVALSGLTMAVYALVDCANTPEDTVRGFPKLWWVGLIAFIAWVGPIAWFVAGRPKKVPAMQVAQRRSVPRGPEDDPDFLRRL